MKEVKVWEASGAAVQGLSHVKNSIPCQDIVYIENGLDVFSIALADGAGSARHSETGADIATKNTCKFLGVNFDSFYEAEANLVQYKIIHALRTSLGKNASKKGAEVKDFASTLLFVVIKGERFIAGHIGDGAIGYLRGNELSVLSPPANGEHINQTYFTTSSNYRHHLRLYKGTLNAIEGFVLMSDGTCESLYDRQSKKIASVVRDIISWLDDYNAEDVRAALENSLENVIKPKTTDDCSLVMMKRVLVHEQVENDEVGSALSVKHC